MLINRIKEFERKHKLDFTEFLNDFENGFSRKSLTEVYDVTELPLRKFVYSLGLEFPSGKRQTSIDEFRYRLGVEQGQDVNLVTTLEKEIRLVANENGKLHRSMVLQRDNNNVLRKQIREDARTDNIQDAILESFVNGFKDFDFKIPTMAYTTSKTKESEEGLCLVLSDEHFGDEVKEDEVPHNVFNYEIADRRMMHVVQDICTFHKQSAILTVFNLLDTLKGIIHGGIYTTEGGFTTSILKAVQIYVKVYSVLSVRYDRVNVIVTLDNHGRKVEKPTTSDKWDNYSVLVMLMVEEMLKAKGITNVNFKFSKHDYNMATINGENILAFHGDSIRSYRPWSAVETAKANDIAMHTFGVSFKHQITGHRHSSCIVDNQYGGKNIQNGGLVGNSAYGMSSGFRPIIPSQTIFFVESDGNIEDTRAINLQGIK